jgi:hypothetical protein
MGDSKMKNKKLILFPVLYFVSIKQSETVVLTDWKKRSYKGSNCDPGLVVFDQ